MSTTASCSSRSPSPPILPCKSPCLPSPPLSLESSYSADASPFASPRNQFRHVMPASIIATASTIVLGPHLFPHIFTLILLTTFTATLLISSMHVYKFITASYKIMQAITRVNKQETSICKHTHVFILPNFGEPQALLNLTLAKLAAHPHARTHYVVVLAMEESESGHLLKSRSLSETFTLLFKAVVVSIHPDRVAGEARGKGSNVNYASRHIQLHLLSTGVDLDECILTIMDSDSHIPPHYIQEVERKLATIPDPYYTLFCPPIFLGRNPDKVPAAVRLTDAMWSCMVIQNLENARSMIFSCSTYSLSMRLAEAVGFWDVDCEAVGEDMHMMMKCFFKTNGRAKSHPIHIPINLTNVHADGYIANIYARYTQAKRHYYGSWDVSYALTEFFVRSTERSTEYLMNGMLIVLHALEAHFIPSVTGLLSAYGVLYFELTHAPSHLTPHFQSLFTLSKILAVASTIPVLLTFLSYHILHFKIERELFKQKSVRRWWHVLDFVMIMWSGFLLCALPSCVSGLKRLADREELYIVSNKAVDERD